MHPVPMLSMCWLQAQQARVCAQVDSDQATVDSLLDELDDAEAALKKARRGRKGPEGLGAAEERLRQANEEIAAVRRSGEIDNHKGELRQLLSHLPELILRYPDVEPFRGTAGEVRCCSVLCVAVYCVLQCTV